MRRFRKELDNLKYDIQREKSVVRAIEREIQRCHGKEVIWSSQEADRERINPEGDFDMNSPSLLQTLHAQHAARLQEMRDRAAYLRHKLDTQLPLTPWGMVIAFLKVWYRQIRT